jgi:hypothetical protein
VFVFADFTAILTDVAETVALVEAALVHPPRALGDFVRAHALEPVDSVGPFLAVDPLLGPTADDLAQTITERRTASGRQTKIAQLAEIGPGRERRSRNRGRIVGSKGTIDAQGHSDCQEAEPLHYQSPLLGEGA